MACIFGICSAFSMGDGELLLSGTERPHSQEFYVAPNALQHGGLRIFNPDQCLDHLSGRVSARNASALRCKYCHRLGYASPVTQHSRIFVHRNRSRRALICANSPCSLGQLSELGVQALTELPDEIFLACHDDLPPYPNELARTPQSQRSPQLGLPCTPMVRFATVGGECRALLISYRFAHRPPPRPAGSLARGGTAGDP